MSPSLYVQQFNWFGNLVWYTTPQGREVFYVLKRGAIRNVSQALVRLGYKQAYDYWLGASFKAVPTTEHGALAVACRETPHKTTDVLPGEDELLEHNVIDLNDLRATVEINLEEVGHAV